MATKSFLKSINIKGRRQLKAFVGALERAERGREKNTDTDHVSYYEVRDPEQIDTLLRKYRRG